MNIRQVNSPNHRAGRQESKPDFIVLHTTGAGFQSAINTIMNAANQVSYHFVISRDGEVVQAVDIQNTAWANGTNNTAGDNRNNQLSTIPAIRERRINANLFSVSIGLGDMPSGNPSPAQLTAAVDLIRHIVGEVRRIYGHTIPFERTNIIGHHEVTPRTRPNCPGQTFPFDEIIRRLNNPRTPEQIPPQPQETPPRTVSLDILGVVQDIGGYIEDGATMVRLTDFSAALGFAASWDGERRIPVISPACEAEARTLLKDVGASEITKAAEDIQLLKQIVHFEARGEGKEGQIMVTNVILNRLKSPRFPNTLHEVIFTPGAFTPTTRPDFGTATPSAETAAAVMEALSGVDLSNGVEFFHAVSHLTPEVFHERAVADGRLVITHEHRNHRFYKHA